jgi:hypothetical protein
MPSIEHCNGCKYAYGPILSGKDVGQYYCRRYPPHGHHPEWHGSFPLVPAASQWCGEYKNGAPTPLGM